MDKKDQRTCANLELIGLVKKNQRLRINFGYDVVGVVDNTPYNNMLALLSWDTWDYTKCSLKKIFTENTPALCKKLIEGDNCFELKIIYGLLKQATEGLCNLKSSYNDDKLILANINSLVVVYNGVQLNKIEQYFQSKNIEPIDDKRETL